MASGRGFGRTVGCLVVLVLAAGALWLARDTIGGWMTRLELGASSEPSERLARQAEEKLDRLAREGLTGEVRISEAELQSLLTYRGGPALPPGIGDPLIDVQDTIVVLSARLRPDSLQGFRAPEALRGALSDTTRVTAGLVPVVERPGRGLVRVRSLQIGALVVPPLMVPAILRSLEQEGVQTSEGALVVPLPRSVSAIRIDGDDLVLRPADGEPPD